MGTEAAPLTHGSLFSGIGGFDLGFERAGIKTVWQVEIDPFCRKVLERHWPDVYRYSDIRDYGERFILERPDVISGGFPCQDISEAGQRAGIDGSRSGLWRDYFGIIRHLRPRFVVVENVTALLNRGIERVIGDLASICYDAEWEVIGADALGASQHRERIWILAYPDDAGFQGPIWAGNRIRRGQNGRLHIANLCDQIVDFGRQDLVRSTTFREWLMGLPIGWTALKPSETPSSRKSRSGSADESWQPKGEGKVETSFSRD